MTAWKSAEDYQQAKKVLKDDQARSKPEGGKHCLVSYMIGHLARDSPNRAYKRNVRSMEEYHNTSTGDEFSKQAVLRYFTCDGKEHISKQCPSAAQFCGNQKSQDLELRI